jgi:hypothetical protein
LIHSPASFIARYDVWTEARVGLGWASFCGEDEFVEFITLLRNKTFTDRTDFKIRVVVTTWFAMGLEQVSYVLGITPGASGCNPCGH